MIKVVLSAMFALASIFSFGQNTYNENLSLRTCQEDTIVFGFDIASPFNLGNQFQVEISDASGNFGGTFVSVSPLFAHGVSTGNEIKVFIPTTISQGIYSFRLISSNPIVVSDTIPFDVTVQDTIGPSLDLLTTGDTLPLNQVGQRVVTVPGIIGTVGDNCTDVDSITISVSYTNVCDNTTQTGTSVTLDCDDVSTLPCAQSVTNPNGLRRFIVTATDAEGNTTTEEIDLFVVDLVAPNVYPKNVTLYLPEDANGNASVTVNAGVYTGSEAGDANDPVGLDSATNDACGIATTGLLQTPTQSTPDASFSYFCTDLGENTYYLRADDVNDNRAATAGVVTIVDTIKPDVTTAIATIFVDAGGNATLDPISLVGTAVDNISDCGLTYAASVVDYSCDDIDFDQTIVNPQSADAQDTDNWGTVDVDLTVTDAAGNERVRAAQVKVVDNIPPVLTRTTITVQLNGLNFVSLQNVQDTIIDFVSDDNCALDLDRGGLSQTYFDCSNVGVNNVTLTMYDEYGNNADVTLLVVVEDLTAPTAVAQDITVQLDANGAASIVSSQIENGSTDNCGIDTYALDITSFDCNDVGENTVTLTVTDVHGNSSTATAVVTVEDNVNPSATNLPFLVTIDANGIAVLGGESSSDNCGVASVVYSPASFGCQDIGLQNYTATVTDVNGNSTVYQELVNVTDVISPVAVVRPTLDIYLDADGEATLTFADLDLGSFDNCSFVPVLDFTEFDCNNVNLGITVNGTLTDPEGNQTTFSSIVTARDTLGPVFTSSQQDTGLYAVQYDCFAMFGIGADPTFTEDDQNCPGSITWIYQWVDENGNKNTISPGSPIPVGTWTVNTVASDPYGNKTAAPFTVTVLDTTKPTMQFLNSPVIALGSNGQTTVTPAMLENSSYDNCGIESVVITPATVDCDDLGSVTFSVTVTDFNDNTTTYNGITGTVEDNDAPSITVVSGSVDIALDANGDASLAAEDVGGAIDNCTANPSLTVSPSSFDCDDLGSVTVTITATDDAGNTSIATKAVNVIDVTAPVITVADITLNLTSNGVVSLPLATASAADNCSSSAVVYSVSNFTCADVGVNVVTVSSTDASNNSSTETFNVTVVDAIAPSITTVGTSPIFALDNSGMATISVSDVVASYADNCDVLSVTISPDSFDCGDLGTVSVQINVSDVNGNTSAAIQDVVIVDDIDPTITVKSGTVTTYLNAAGVATIAEGDVVATTTDNCTLAPTVSLSATSFSCSEVGSNTITITATDGSGNSSTATKNVVVMDTISPSITAPSAVTLSLGAGGSVTLPGNTASASDNCGATTLTYSETSFNCSDIGTTNVVVTATDANGNDSEATIAVTVQDVTNPTLALVSSGITLALDANGSTSLTTSQIVSSVSDNCSGVTVSVSPSSFGCSDLGSNTVTVTATDASGNTTVQTGTVTVVDLIDPTITTVASPSDVVLDASGNATLTTAMVVASVTDNCTTVPTVTITPTSVDCSDIGIVTVTVIAADNNGNTSTTTVPLNVVDQDAPVIVSAPGDTTLPACNSQYNYVVNVTDNCGYTATLTSGLAPGAIFPVGTTTVEWVFADASGNSVSHSFEVTVDSLGTYTLPTKDEFCFDNGPFDLQNGQTGLVWTGAGVTAAGDVFQPAQAGIGTHTLGFTFTDANGCEQIGTYTVTVQPTPQQPTVLQITPTTLSSSENGAIYKWYRNGVRIVGQTNKDLFITQGGNYQVEVYNAYGCFRRSTGFVISATGLSVEELLKGVNIYPNPTTSNVSIAFNSALDSELDVEMVDMLGRTFFRGSIPAGDLIFTIDLSSITAGTYQLIIRDEATGNSTIERIIKVD